MLNLGLLILLLRQDPSVNSTQCLAFLVWLVETGFFQPGEHQALLLLILSGSYFPQPWVVTTHSHDDQQLAKYLRGVPFTDFCSTLFSDDLFYELWPLETPQTLSSISSTHGVFWDLTGSLLCASQLNRRADLFCHRCHFLLFPDIWCLQNHFVCFVRFFLIVRRVNLILVTPSWPKMRI